MRDGGSDEGGERAPVVRPDAGGVARSRTVAEKADAADPPNVSEPADGEVVSRVLKGEGSLFGLLVRRYGDALYRHAERMVDRPDEAADLVQVAFVRGYRDLGRCREPERVGGWLFRICANLCKDHLKSRRRRDLSLDDVPLLAWEAPDPAQRTELREAITSALARLTPEQKEAFLLKHHEGYSYEEMAEVLGQPVPALKMRVHRARAELQTLLERYR